ncbi:ELMO/CED-12 family protein [Zea mays]|uniref:ELMO/CED-12 family protein n=1 Tax=Zea mays TaxID=4577 RepID=A0A1D6JBK2_MAIZE|nr:ELMO/CED-12 family protein [Zea mays]
MHICSLLLLCCDELWIFQIQDDSGVL